LSKTIGITAVLWACLGVAGAQQGNGNNIAARSGAGTSEWGVLTQGGLGLTDNRDGFRFFMAGIHAGRVLTNNVGPGPLRGNMEYAIELFPFWQSYTPVTKRQNCVALNGPASSPQSSCSAPFSIGGTYTGVSLTPIILRWNFAGTRRWAPWMQGAGGVVWTNHKYPPFGGPPVSNGGLSTVPVGNNGPAANTSVWNFTPQFGVGVHYFLKPRRSLDLGANAIHISSASLGDKNPGVNASVQFSVGYTWWK